MSVSKCLLALALAVGVNATSAPALSAADKPLLQNGSFIEWKNSVPVGWKVSIGARRGSGKQSTIRPGQPASITLSGDAATREWNFVSQRLDCQPGDTFQLRFHARATGIRRDTGQFDNCYVGFLFRGANGKTVAAQIRNIRSPTSTPEILIARVPKTASACDVAIFLSKTGTLEAGGFELRKLDAADSYATLIEHMDRYYSYFAHRKIDWQKLAARYEQRAKHAKTPQKFAAVVKELLAHLKDIHVRIELPDGKRMFPVMSRVDGNYNFRSVARKLKGVKQIGRIAFTGRTADGFGYVAIGSLSGADALFGQIETAIDGMLDAKGFIVDLRSNSGGSEPRAQRIAAIFADKKRPYAQSQFRAGPKHTDFTGTYTRSIAPRNGKTFTRPVVCLIGPRCVSSGEAFALMLKAQPHVRLVGLPTRGASGNPRPITLPNGVTVYYSRWVAMQADGQVFESKGIAPDVTVKHAAMGDPTFDRAVEELKKQIARGESR